jgi:hypothetical protein
LIRLGRCANEFQDTLRDVSLKLHNQRDWFKSHASNQKSFEYDFAVWLTPVIGGRHDLSPTDLDALLTMAKYSDGEWDSIGGVRGALQPIELLRTMRALHDVEECHEIDSLYRDKARSPGD